MLRFVPARCRGLCKEIDFDDVMEAKRSASHGLRVTKRLKLAPNCIKVLQDGDRSEDRALRISRKNAKRIVITVEMTRGEIGGSSSSYYSEEEQSDQEEKVEQSRYEARIANNQVRLNLFNSKSDESAFNNFYSLRSGTEFESFQEDGADYQNDL